MALIDNGNIGAGLTGSRPPLSESDWTRLMLRHGHAELADSERKRESLDSSPAVLTPPSETTTAPIDRRREDKRTKSLLLRLTPEEHALIKSQRQGKAVAQWIRESAVERAQQERDAYRWDDKRNEAGRGVAT